MQLLDSFLFRVKVGYFNYRILKGKKVSIPWMSICFSTALLIIGIPSYQYYKQFSVYGISSKTEAWAQLGDFLNVWVSMASLIILGGLTHYLHSLDSKREIDNQNIEAARSRPYLVIVIDRPSIFVKNVGNGPAMNIRNAIFSNGNWSLTRRIGSLMPGETEFLMPDNIKSDDVVGFSFYDIHETVYSSLHQKDLIDFYRMEDIFDETIEFEAAKGRIVEKVIYEFKFKRWQAVYQAKNNKN